ncbi:MAG: FtsW/RodA/SpoVE family cell cycle protein [Planctomycetota bacterium]|nr:FtsW/RodA/SpoVE family cell cycle protein [Planctomycetota bacterium]
MARFRKRAGQQGAALEAPTETQLSIFARIGTAAAPRPAASPREPARAIFGLTIGMIALGLVMQVSHAATTMPLEAFREEVVNLVVMRGLAVLVLLGAWWVGLARLRPFVPALAVTGLLLLLLVFVPGFAVAINGSRRWIQIPGLPFTIQPSEVARVLAILWLARRCVDLGDRVSGLRGYVPTVLAGVVVALLIIIEPDVGSTLLFGVAWMATMWVGGFQERHLAVSAVGGVSMVVVGAASVLGYVRERLSVWLGDVSNDQVLRNAEAFGSGGWFGQGLAQGGYRNDGLQYMQTDYVCSLVGEELGLFGVLVLVALWGAFVWNGLRLVRTVKNRFAALAAFGLTVGVTTQAMIHLAVATQLSPPKGMTLPLISDGGSALMSTCLAIGLILGASRGESHPI